jgi:predicted P-loop ATPase
MAEHSFNLNPDLPPVEADETTSTRSIGAHVAQLASAQKGKRRARPDRPDWLRSAVEDDYGRIIPNLANVALALRQAPDLREAFSFDELQRQVIVDRELPLAEGAEQGAAPAPPRPFADADASQLQEWLQWKGMPKVSRETVHQAIHLRAQERAFHPVRDYLDAIAWDGVARLDDWLARYLRAEASPYVSAIGRMFLIAAVARIFQPGAKCDYVLVLEGSQGAGKSRACECLGAPWFSDSLPDVTYDKDAAQHLRGKWIVEISELSALGRAESEALKSFISRPVERYRPPYGREEVVEPRQCVFIGTTNRSTYLGDDTGARRFWPVRVGTVDIAALEIDRDQLFAEAAGAYRAGEQWWPKADFERAYIRPEQDARFESDAWESTIANFLIGRERVQVTEIARDALLIETARVGTKEQRRIAAILTSLGWTHVKDWQGRAYVRSGPGA